MGSFRVSVSPGTNSISVKDERGIDHAVDFYDPAFGNLCLAAKTVDTLVDNYTVDEQDMGKILLQTVDGKALTLPAVSGYGGFEFTYKNGGADGAVILTIHPDANDKIMGADWAGADHKNAINTKATAKLGDFMTLRCDANLGWWIVAKRGIWAAEAP
jgi:hypothetical protein